MTQKRYIQVILPLRLEWEPCYYLTEGEVRPGDRVQVMFAGRRQIGVVSAVDISANLPENKIHPVLSIETGLEKVTPQEIELWRFMAEYYMCTVGEVYKASYPSLKTNSEEIKARADKRRAALAQKSAELWKARIEKLSAQLAAKELELARKHKESVMDTLRRQRDRLEEELAKARQKLASAEACGEEGQKDYSALAGKLQAGEDDRGMDAAFRSGKPVLLVSPERYGSYISLAAQTLRKGRNVLILVSESALAGELRSRLEGFFGELLIVHLSALTPARKREISAEMRAGRPYVLIGTRSSIFLPHNRLGLVIVDNEQSPFYKQSDGAPRYNARDCAVKLALIHGAKVILGTGSPSMESRLNAMTGRYVPSYGGATEGNGPKCRFMLVDVSSEKRKNGMLGPLSRKLIAQAGAMRRIDPTCRIALIRGYEREDELSAAVAGCPQLEGSSIFTIPQASRTDFSGFDLVAMLSADALFDPADFRSDEHAFQFLDSLRGMSPNVLVQTAQAKHQVFSISDTEPLLSERLRFHLPPYTRLVDVRIPNSGKAAALAEAIYRTMLEEGLDAAYPLPGEHNTCIRVTLKRDPSLQAKKKMLRSIVEGCRSRLAFSGNVILDADPV